MQFLVTTQVSDIPKDVQIIMVDGTVPGWQIQPGDRHYDHHKPNGADIQIDEIPREIWGIEESCCFVTTQLDADACAAAAWIILLGMDNENVLDENLLDRAKTYLRAIAYDCDHLMLPMEQEFMELSGFARDAVATMKLSGPALIKERGYSEDKNTWPEEQKVEFDSFLFGRQTEWLVNAALERCSWPGQNGEAWQYWEKFEADREFIHRLCRMYKNVGILELPSFMRSVDPRHLIEWVRLQDNHSNITLTIRQRPLKLWRESLDDPLILYSKELDDPFEIYAMTLPAYSFTLGSVPLHPAGNPRFSDGQSVSVWDILTHAEKQKRVRLSFPPPTTFWGGRNAVGGSSWNDAAILTPEEIITKVLVWKESIVIHPLEQS